MSSFPDEASEAKSWLGTAEDVFFQRLQEISSTQLGELALNLKLDMIRAAYCLAQNWEGSDAAKKRTRQLRLTTVIIVTFPVPG